MEEGGVRSSRPPVDYVSDNPDQGWDGRLWEDFKNRYVATSREILERRGKGRDEEVRMLPKKVMEMVESTRGKWRKGE